MIFFKFREQAIDYNDHEPLTVINNGAVIRTSKSALQKSRMDRLQEDRDYEERERGAFRGRGRGRGGRGRGRDRAGGFSRSGRDDGGNANEVIYQDKSQRISFNPCSHFRLPSVIEGQGPAPQAAGQGPDLLCYQGEEEWPVMTRMEAGRGQSLLRG